jgi:hypothetical protein
MAFLTASTLDLIRKAFLASPQGLPEALFENDSAQPHRHVIQYRHAQVAALTHLVNLGKTPRRINTPGFMMNAQ